MLALLLSIVCVNNIAHSLATSVPNILFVTLDDIGFGDLGVFGAEWETPNLDTLLKDESLYLSRYYSGYTDGSARAEIMTGVHSFHQGFGTSNSYKRESDQLGKHGMIGSISLGTYTMAEWIKYKYNNNNDNSNTGNNKYKNYFIGNWQLGYSITEHTPTKRGFDYFYGSYSDENDVMTKKSSVDSKITDISMIRQDKTEYLDFWENLEPVFDDANDKLDLNSLFTLKTRDIISQYSKDDKNSNEQFLLHLSFASKAQYIHSKTHDYALDIKDECKSFLNIKNSLDIFNNVERLATCEYMLDLDRQVGDIVKELKSNDLWSNTALFFVSDNGGSQATGSCNYPFRGGKYSYFDGNIHPVAFVSGGALPESQRGKTFDHLFSSVDWTPTILSMTSTIDNDIIFASNLDGFNYHSKLFGLASGNNNVRDHIMLHISALGTENLDLYTKQRVWKWASDETDASYTSGSVSKMTLNEIAIVFYDESGQLYKYFVNEVPTQLTEIEMPAIEEILSVESNWCMRDNENNNNLVKTIEYSTYGYEEISTFSGLFALDSDVSESNNLLKTIDQDTFKTLKSIVIEKADVYLNTDYNDHAEQLYSIKNCFYDTNNYLAYPPLRSSSNVWRPFMKDLPMYVAYITKQCALVSEHPIFTNMFPNESPMTLEDQTAVVDITHQRGIMSQSKATTSSNVESVFDSLSSKFTIVSESSNDVTSLNAELSDSENVYNSCEGLANGIYYIWVDFDPQFPTLIAQCSNNYMMINYDLDPNWEHYFSSWQRWVTKTISPVKNDLVTWEQWFLPDGGVVDSGDDDDDDDDSDEDVHNYNYIISPQCDVCNEDSLIQSEGKQTTYFINQMATFCFSGDRGQPAGQQYWDTYMCRRAMYHVGLYNTERIESWQYTDNIGIDKSTLLTATVDNQHDHISTCATRKGASNHEVFTTRYDCEQESSGADGVTKRDVPSLGTEGEFCVCAKKADNSNNDETMKAQSKPIKEINDQSIATKIVKEDAVVEKKDLRKHNIVYLSQKDFNDGTYRIKESGTYIITEDITFDFNSPDYSEFENNEYSANGIHNEDGDFYWYPKHSQSDEYNGAYEWHETYLYGFFAGIAIECDYVHLDLNGYTLKMDERFYYQQPFWAHIELGSQPFMPGEGPSNFGYNPSFTSHVKISNGVLGLTSHHCIHGTAPLPNEMADVEITNLVCKDFTTHGIQINGFNGLKMDNIEVGPNANMQRLTVDYSQMRVLMPRLEYYADYYEYYDVDNVPSIQFAGKPSEEYLELNNIAREQVSLSNDKAYTLREIVNECQLQMDLAFWYVLGFKSFDELYDEYGITWLQAKRVFVNDDSSEGVPYGGVMYGIFLNAGTAGISGFHRNPDFSYNAQLSNIKIHDLTHATQEQVYSLQAIRSVLGLPSLAQNYLGDKQFSEFNSWNDHSKTDYVYYYGTIALDLLFAFYTIVGDDMNNIESLAVEWVQDDDWIQGETTITQKRGYEYWTMSCNGDAMFHSTKGIFGLRLAGINNAQLDNIEITNLREISPFGSDMCGEYEQGHELQSQLPYLYGYTGNNVHGISLLHSRVLFKDLQVTLLESLTGNATGISVYTQSNVMFEGNNLFENIISGSLLYQNNIDSLEYLEDALVLPNFVPRACDISLETFDNSMSQIQFDNAGTILSQCVKGHNMCQFGRDTIDFVEKEDSDCNYLASDLITYRHSDIYDEDSILVKIMDNNIDSDAKSDSYYSSNELISNAINGKYPTMFLCIPLIIFGVFMYYLCCNGVGNFKNKMYGYQQIV